jgi:hypothetical protein
VGSSIPIRFVPVLAARSWNRRPLAEGAAIAWLVGVGVAFLAPALSNGSALGPYDLLHLLGITATAHPSVHNAIDSDEIQEFIAWQALAWHQVHAGALPLWDRFNLLGMPYGFNFESAPFSLTVALSYAFPLGLAHTATVAARLAIAGSGAYVLGRMLRLGILPSVLGATIFELSGAFTIWVGTYEAGCYCFLGWILAASVGLLRARRRAAPAALLALCLALAFAAGEPQVDALVVVVLVVFVGVVSIARVRTPQGWSGRLAGRVLLDHALALAAGVGLAAPLVLPAGQLLVGSARSTGPYVSALPPHEIIHLLFASYSGVPTTLASYIGPNDSYVSMVYVGAIALALALAGLAWIRRRPEALAFGILVAVLVVALFFPPVVTAMRHVPGLRYFRLDLATTPMDFALAMLAAFGAQALVRARRKAPSAPGTPGPSGEEAHPGAEAGAASGAGAEAGAASGAGVEAGAASGAGVAAGVDPDAGVRLWADRLFIAGTVLLAITLAVFEVRVGVSAGHLTPKQIAVRQGSFVWPTVSVAACALVAIARAVMRHGVGGPGTRRPRFAARAALWGDLLAGRIGIALLIAVQAAFCIVSGAWFVSSTSNPLPVTPAVASLEHLTHGELVGIGACAENAFADLGIMPNVNAAYGIPEMTDYDPIMPKSYYSSYGKLTGGSTSPLVPHVFCPAISSVRVARAYGVAFVLEPPGQPGPRGTTKVAVVHGEGLYAVPGAEKVSVLPTAPAPPGASVVSAHESVGGTWRVRVRAAARSKLIFRLTAVPGWRATMDGQPLTLHRVDTVLLEAVVPAGRHVVVLRYWPALFSAGLVTCAVTAALLLGAVAWEWRRRRDGGARIA